MATHRITAVQTLHAGWSRFMKLTVQLPDGQTIEREVEDHGAAVAVLPYDPVHRTAILVRQFRVPVFHTAGSPDLLEVPAGILDEDDPAACARREAMEEIGLQLRGLESVGTVWTSPGVSTERMHLFLAAYRPEDRVTEGGGLAEENEQIQLVEISLQDLSALLDRGAISDMKTLALTQALRLRHAALFGAAAE